MRLPGYCIWLPLLVMGYAARADIYRCSGEFSEPYFSQQPCGDASTVALRQAPAGEGPATGLRPSERAWLDRRERGRGKVKKRKPRVTQAAAKTAAATQAYRCRSKRRSLDEVKAKLRRGYKPASGERLRRRRRAYEDYLATFCS